MPKTLDQMNEHYERLADLVESDDFEPGGTWNDGPGLRAVMAAHAKRVEVENEVAASVIVARADGVSWRLIGAALGTSGPAARQRYGHLVEH